MGGDAPLSAPGRQHLDACLRHAGRHGKRSTPGGNGVMPLLLSRAQVTGVLGEHHLQCFRQVLQQVEAVGDLDGLGGAVAGALGVGATPVA